MRYLDPFWSVKRCGRGMTDWELTAKDDLIETALAGTASACSRLTSAPKVSTYSRDQAPIRLSEDTLARHA